MVDISSRIVPIIFTLFFASLAYAQNETKVVVVPMFGDKVTSNQSYFAYSYQDSLQELTLGAHSELVHFQKVVDPYDLFDESRSNEHFTAPVAGYYSFTADVSFKASSTTMQVGLGWKLNHDGDTEIEPERVIFDNSIDGDGLFSISNTTIYELSAGDTISVWVIKQNPNGGTQIRNRSFTSVFIGEANP